MLNPSSSEFPVTRWPLVQQAIAQGDADAHAALSSLCEIYYRPLLAVIRSQGYRAEDTDDLRQGFFTHLVKKGKFSKSLSTGVKLRAFLLQELKGCQAHTNHQKTTDHSHTTHGAFLATALLIGILVTVNSPVCAAVIMRVLPEPLEIFNTSVPVDLLFPFDVDDNGTTDFQFTATFSDVGLRTELANRQVIKLSPPPNIGGPVASLGSGYPIGHNLIGSNLAWSSSDLSDGYVSPQDFATSIIIQVFFSDFRTICYTALAIRYARQ